MQIRILGCSGGIGAGLRTTSILIDEEILIDTGTGIGDLSLDELRQINHVFMTHSHLDHTAGLPLLVDTIFDSIETPLKVYARQETITALKEHIFNWVLWPDFSALPNAENPVMRYAPMKLGDIVSINDKEVALIEVNHTVPGAGYIVTAANGKVFAFSGDTSTNDTFWAALNALPRVDILVIETAFGNRLEELAWLSRHYCPKTLAADLNKLKHKPEVYITHLKPGGEDEIFEEIAAALPDRKPQRLLGGEVFEL
ncbi:MAG: 3',5'-cyclic-nucleotide phosphodiesterase [Gammaproteobacteria bacterium]|nr:3',5'-cyclic-nucleotide phosphodiesterase [Gammaproteobacteria bacterium]